MRKVKVTRAPKQGDQVDYSLIDGKTNPAAVVGKKKPKVTDKMGAEPDLEKANVEVENGEVAVGDVNQDGYLEHMTFVGKTHSNGGIPVFLPEGSFVFSNTKNLRITDTELLETTFGIKGKKKAGYTPAEIAKKYPINRYMDDVKSRDTDEITKRSSSTMIQNNLKKLGELALIQESMKGFPDGIPAIAESVVAGIAPEMQQAKFGGNVSNKMQQGGTQRVNEDNLVSSTDYRVTKPTNIGRDQLKKGDVFYINGKKAKFSHRDKNAYIFTSPDGKSTVTFNTKVFDSSVIDSGKVVQSVGYAPGTVKPIIYGGTGDYFNNPHYAFLGDLTGTNRAIITTENRVWSLKPKPFTNAAGDTYDNGDIVEYDGQHYVISNRADFDHRTPNKRINGLITGYTYDENALKDPYVVLQPVTVKERDKDGNISKVTHAKIGNSKKTITLRQSEVKKQVVKTNVAQPLLVNMQKKVEATLPEYSRTSYYINNKAKDEPITLGSEIPTEIVAKVDGEEVEPLKQGVVSSSITGTSNKPVTSTGATRTATTPAGTATRSSTTTKPASTPTGVRPASTSGKYTQWGHPAMIEYKESNPNIVETNVDFGTFGRQPRWGNTGIYLASSEQAARESGDLSQEEWDDFKTRHGKLIEGNYPGGFEQFQTDLRSGKDSGHKAAEWFQDEINRLADDKIGTWYFGEDAGGPYGKDSKFGQVTFSVPNFYDLPVEETVKEEEPKKEVVDDTEIDDTPQDDMEQAPVKEGTWWLPDIVNFAGTMTDDINRYEPVQGKVDLKAPGYALLDPSRQIASVQEQMNQYRKMLDAGLDPNTAAASALASSGEGLKNIANALSTVEGQNVGIVNQAMNQSAQIEAQETMANEEYRRKYVEDMATLGQQEDLSKSMRKWRRIATFNKGMDNWYKKKQMEQVLFPQVFIDPITGDPEFSGKGRDWEEPDLYQNPMYSGSTSSTPNYNYSAGSNEAQAVYTDTYEKMLMDGMSEDQAEAIALKNYEYALGAYKTPTRGRTSKRQQYGNMQGFFLEGGQVTPFDFDE